MTYRHKRSDQGFRYFAVTDHDGLRGIVGNLFLGYDCVVDGIALRPRDRLTWAEGARDVSRSEAVDLLSSSGTETDWADQQVAHLEDHLATRLALPYTERAEIERQENRAWQRVANRRR